MAYSAFDKCLTETRKLAKENERIAIHASLESLFTEACDIRPRTIVELGVSKEALANKVLAMVAELNNSDFFSCDLYDFSEACSYPKWTFHQGDDVQFASLYPGPPVDLLFIDTNELYHHVCDEIKAWVPKLSPRATVMFRCTNLQKILFYENGRTTGLGWNNDRGVIRAIEDTLHVSFDETKTFEGSMGGWSIKHWPWGAGLTVLRRE